MAVSAITALATITLGASQTTVTFSSISGAYRDLYLVVNCTAATSGNLLIQLNGDTGSSFNWVRMSGIGSGSGFGGASAGTIGYISYANTVPTSDIMTCLCSVLDYSANDKHKTILTRNDVASSATEVLATRWMNTAVVVSLKVLMDAGQSFTAGSTFTLYGISA